MTDGLERVVRTAAKVVVAVIVTLLVLTAIGWVIGTVGDGPDESDVTTLEGAACGADHQDGRARSPVRLK